MEKILEQQPRQKNTQHFNNLEDAKKLLLQKFGQDLRFATPLGLGKPNQLINLIYQSAKADPRIRLKLFTALSLSIPKANSNLEKRFLTPFLKRHFGDTYPQLDYTIDSKLGKIPENIEVHEFYMQAAQNLTAEAAQRHYTSLNYTHVAQSLFDDDIQCVIQLVAKRTVGGKTTYSLSCNPDLTLDVIDIFNKNNKKLFIIGVVHPDLPFLGFDAEIDADFFDVLVDSSEVTHKLFALPRQPLDIVDHSIGLYASQLIEDDGTLQIGIGSLSDAIIAATLQRHQKNTTYLRALEMLWQFKPRPSKKSNLFLHTEPFQKGLYGTSEMLMDAFMHLRNAKILVREIFDLDEKKRCYLHGAFFLGSHDFYHWLRELSPTDYTGLSMTRVSKVNDLYDHNELALRRQRKKARFFNTCMQMTLLGGAASDTLENGQVVSGVGGQYNFVAMSHELPDSHSVLLLRSVRESRGKRISNIVWSHGHQTISRHLRDIVITEYGIATLKGRTDEEVIKALINIADSEFQPGLLVLAKKYGKLDQDYQLPTWASNNSPESLKSFFSNFQISDYPPYPFGSDFTFEEEKLSLALPALQKNSESVFRLIHVFWKGLCANKYLFTKELMRLQLDKPHSPKEWVYQKLVLGSLLSIRI